MLTRRILIGVSLAGSMVLAGSAFAQGQPVVGISTVTTYSADARITAVDPAARTVSLAFTNGATAVRQVSPSVANFAQTKVGDMVSLAFEDRLTFVLSGPNTKTPGDRDTNVTVAARHGHGRRGRLGRPGGRHLVGHRRQSDSRHDLVGQSGRRRDPHLQRQHGGGPRAAAARQAGRFPDGDQQQRGRHRDHAEVLRLLVGAMIDAYGMSVRMPGGGAGVPDGCPACDDSVPRKLTSAPRRLSVSVPPATRPLAEAALVVQPAASGRRRLPLTVPAASTTSETGRLPQTG